MDFYPCMPPDNCKRFCLCDELGYFRSYKTRRRALQAIKDIGRSWVGCGVWKLIDRWDNSVSFIVGNKEETD